MLILEIIYGHLPRRALKQEYNSNLSVSSSSNKKEPLPKSSFMLGLSGSLFFSYSISGHIRG